MYTNPAYGNKFRFEFTDEDTKDINDSIIGVDIPGISANGIEKQIDGNTIKLIGNVLDITDLSITVKLDSEYKSWIKFVKWVIDNQNGSNKYSNAGLFLLGRGDLPLFTLSFSSIFPISISPISYTRIDDDPQVLTFTVELKVNEITYSDNF